VAHGVSGKNDQAVMNSDASLPRRQPLVLLVEDYRDTREMYAQYLRFSGFRVVGAEDGYEALSKAASTQPDIILMDLALPGLDGWEATAQLKSSPVTDRIPVVALTGHTLAVHEERARCAGCDAFLAKPCPPDQVVDEIWRLLGEHAPDRADMC
jgi:CheY-like chemotaxis protein